MASTLTAKGQVVIPKEIRDELHLNAGDTVDFMLESGEIKLKVFKKVRAESLAGVFKKYAKPGISYEEAREEMKERVAYDAAREDED